MDEMSLVTIHPKRIRWMKNPWDVVSGFKHDNRLKCHRGIVSQWTFQVGLNVTGQNVGGRNVKAPLLRGASKVPLSSCSGDIIFHL